MVVDLDNTHILYHKKKITVPNETKPNNHIEWNFTGLQALQHLQQTINIVIPASPGVVLIDSARIAKLKENMLVINAWRGEVIDNQALLEALQAGKQLELVLDVWENEPNILTELLPFFTINFDLH